MSRSRRLLAIVAGIIAAQLGISLLAHNSYGLTAVCDVLQSALMAWATVAMVLNLRRSSGRTRTFWLLMSAGFALWFISNLSWTWFEVVRRQPVPNPFVADVVLFIHIVPLLAALAIQPQSRDSKLTFGALDLALLMVWWLYLYLILVIPWQYVEANLGRYGYTFNLTYLLETACFVTFAGILWRRSQGSWRTLYGHLFGAGLLYMLGSQLASLAIDQNKYYTGSLYDVPLVAAIAWFAWVGLSAKSMHDEAAEEVPGHRVLTWPAFLAMAAVLSTPLIALWIVTSGDVSARVTHFRLLLTLGAIFLMSALLFLRQVLLDRRLVEMLWRSHESLARLRELQAQLLQSEKLASLGRLVGGAAHEINNPLTAISGYAEMLREKGGDTAPVAQKIVEQCRRTKSLVSDLLIFSQEMRAERTPVHVDAVLSSALKLKEPDLVARNIRVKMNSNGDLRPISGDANQILNVFLRVIANAIDALETKSGGMLEVTAAAEQDSIVIEFRDNGPGVTEPARIFDPFYTTKPVGKGAGLGLSVCYGIVKSHRGQITCSNNPEGGATFRISFPIARAAAAAAEK